MKIFSSQICISGEDLVDDISNIKEEDSISFDGLSSFDPCNWLGQRPFDLVPLICNLCGYSLPAENLPKPVLMKVVKIIKIIYGARNSRIVLPLSFYENVVTFTQTRNKKLIKINNRISPGNLLIYCFSVMVFKMFSEQSKLCQSCP